MALALCLAVLCPVSFADSNQDRRAQAGARLFRSLLAADLDLTSKTVDDGKLLVVFFYTTDRRRAEELAASLRGPDGAAEKIRDLPLVIETTGDPTFAAYANRKPAAIFLAQPPSSSVVDAIVRYGIANGLIVYSPFEGHVERGVLGGLSVEAQVRPYVNLSTLQASNISLKSFFMKVTKVHQ